MAEDSETFLQRWARLKAERAKEEKVAATSSPVSETQPRTGSETQPVKPEELPAVDELTKDSDFTQFLKAGVPPELKRLALRKLWRTDPVFANLDGLLEYGEDFGAPFRNPGPVTTLFRLGQGMPGPGEMEQVEEGAAQVEAVEQAAPSDPDAPRSDQDDQAPPGETAAGPSDGSKRESGGTV